MTRCAYRQHASSTDWGAAKVGVGLRTMPAIAIVAYLSFMGHLIGGLLSWRIIAHLADQLPPILLGSQTAAHSRKLLLGERNGLPLLARDLNEAWLGAGACRRQAGHGDIPD